MEEIYKDEDISEFKDGYFYYFLYNFYNGEMDDERFSELIGKLISWSGNRENETDAHFLAIQEIMLNSNDDPIEFGIKVDPPR